MIQRLDVRYRAQASRDLEDIFRYVAERSRSLDVALNYVLRIEARCQKVGDAPRAGRVRDDLAQGLRTVTFERSALICYLVDEESVWITNVFHGGRDIAAFFSGETPGEPGE